MIARLLLDRYTSWLRRVTSNVPVHRSNVPVRSPFLKKNCNPHDDPLWYTNREGSSWKNEFLETVTHTGCMLCVRFAKCANLKMIVTESKDCRRDWLVKDYKGTGILLASGSITWGQMTEK